MKVTEPTPEEINKAIEDAFNKLEYEDLDSFKVNSTSFLCLISSILFTENDVHFFNAIRLEKSGGEHWSY